MMSGDSWNPGPTTVAWIERSIGPGARVHAIEGMPASSTAKHRIEVAFPNGSTTRVVLRCYHDAKCLATDPWYVPAQEAHALRLLEGSAVPTPHLYAADLETVFCDVPALLESWVPGVADWRPRDLGSYLARTAEVLVAIHSLRVPPDAPLARYAPYEPFEHLVSPPFSTRPGLWERVAEVLRAPRPAHRETFIHRDYHPGNVLWDGARVTGVVDWATAAWGPPGIDLARMRLNLAARLGPGAADRFLDDYAAAGGDPAARDPYWDLLDAADALPRADAAMEPGGGELRRFEDYVASVLAER